VADLTKRFHQPRAAVVCHIMHWGLSRGQAGTLDGGASEGPVRHLSLFVDTAWHARVEQAASAAGVKTAPWLRAMVRQITITDVPTSWEEDRAEQRSPDSRDDDKSCMLRLDQPSRRTLQGLVKRFGVSKAAIIRQLIAHATPDDFPSRWPKTAAERHSPPRRGRRGTFPGEASAPVDRLPLAREGARITRRFLLGGPLWQMRRARPTLTHSGGIVRRV
jgi:hypothetical protein